MARTVADQDLHYDLTHFGGAVAALFPVTASRFLVEAGPELGFGWATQRLALPGRPSFASGVLWAGGAVMATLPVGPVRLGLDASAGVQAFKLNGGNAVRAAGSLSLIVLLYGF
jgi:hypothetical protein